jgi:hypothetical protein
VLIQGQMDSATVVRGHGRSHGRWRWSLLLLLLVSAGLVAAERPVLEVFVREGCPHCEEAKAFLGPFAREHPGVTIVYRPVDRDAEALDALITHTQAAGSWPPGVPSFVHDGRLLIGFSADGSTAAVLAAWIDADLEAAPPASAIDTPVGLITLDRLGLPLFTVALGLLDGFNPCAMWVLLFLLSMLVHLRDRRRIALIAGTFVLASGLVYYAFMAAWLNLFLALGMSTALRVTLAVLALIIAAINLKDFAVGLHGPSLSIPESAKPSLYARVRTIVQARSLPVALAAVALLALLVNTIELLCTAGLPALYTAVLSQQALSPAAHYAYLGLYILGYMTDDALMVGLAVFALGSRRLGERGGRWLKGISGMVMLVLGCVLLLRPQWFW